MNVNIRDWTFTHWWVRPVVKIWFDIYHKSITYSGTEHIDWQKPIIFAPSHQNAFSDALCLILPTRYTNNRFIYPLIRADAFGSNKAIDWILTAFHMLPVYRPRDNVNLKEQNENVFGHCYKILSKNRNLLIHPEGNCIPKKQVRRFKKGLARIALGAEEVHDFNLGVTVVPVGINYREITEARKGIHIQYGTPVPVSDFEDTYREHAAYAITALTRQVEKGVKEVTVDINSDAYYQLTEELLRLAKRRNPDFTGTFQYTKDEVVFEKELIGKLKNAEQKNPGLPGNLEESVSRIHSTLDGHKLDLKNSLIEKSSFSRLTLSGIAYVALLPVFLYGWINNILPWFLIHKLADTVKKRQFKSSVRMVSGLLFLPLSYFIQAGVFWGLSGSGGWTLAYLLSLPLGGIVSLNIWERWKEWRQEFRLKLLPQKEKAKLFSLFDELFVKLRADTSACTGHR